MQMRITSLINYFGNWMVSVEMSAQIDVVGRPCAVCCSVLPHACEGSQDR